MVTRIGASVPLRQIMTTRLSLRCRVDLRQNVWFLTLDTAVAEALLWKGQKNVSLPLICGSCDVGAGLDVVISMRKHNDASEITNNMPKQQPATNCNWQRRTHISYQKATLLF